MGITSAQAAELNYRQFLESLKQFNKAEADYAAVIDSYIGSTRRRMPGESAERIRKFAEMAASADNALAAPQSRCAYFGNRVQTYAAAYQVEQIRAAELRSYIDPLIKRQD